MQVSVVVGDGNRGFKGDGLEGPRAELNGPNGISAIPGYLFIADTDNQRVTRYCSIRLLSSER